MLSTEEARSYYDRFGRKQDSQGFYEDPATGLLIELGEFEEARSVFEFGIGTGRFAQKLLSEHTPSGCEYRGVDISPTMIDIAKERLRDRELQTSIELTSGETRLSADENRYERFVSNYVIDLMAEEDARTLIGEAHRILKPGGLLCLVSLTHGKTFPSRIVSFLWNAVYRVNARIVGGCRPIELQPIVPESGWEILHRRYLACFGITSEILVARKRG